MATRLFSFEREPMTSFNMTPVIDIVFLLIIFFALVFKFIEAENFPVTVPDSCGFAQNQVEQTAPTTITVIKGDSGMSDFAVGSDKVLAANYNEIPSKLADLINKRLTTITNDKTITLRIDKNVPYSQAQFALAGIAKSSATDIRLAVIKEQQQDIQKKKNHQKRLKKDKKRTRKVMETYRKRYGKARKHTQKDTVFSKDLRRKTPDTRPRSKTENLTIELKT
jgi:biopolymer transport protein ExbD